MQWSVITPFPTHKNSQLMPNSPRPAIAPFGARYLARGTAAAVFEAGLKERVVITEFPSLDKAKGAYECAAYQEALRALGDGAVRDFRIVEGLE